MNGEPVQVTTLARKIEVNPNSMSTMTAVPAKKIPLLDLQAQFSGIREEVMAEIARVAGTQKFILGEEVERLEQSIAAYSYSRYGVGCASGSDALLLTLMGLGINPGDEVLTVPYTFFATAGAISRVGARPVFIDVEEATFNLDVSQLVTFLEAHPRVRAVLPVHLFGGCADMDPICRAAGERRIPVIEDAAHSIGAEYKGRRAGSIGAAGCFSFFPSKNLGAFGDGGMITTNSADLARRLSALRSHGRTGKYIHEWVGVNSRLDALQAAILRVKLRRLDRWTLGRAANAERYRRLFAEKKTPVIAPAPAGYQNRHVYNQFVIRCSRRDALQKYLKEHGVGTEVYYPLPLHLQTCFADLGYKSGDFPVSERLAAESLALPIYSELEPGDIERVVDLIQAFYS
jgi:dTDP-4-amino-4,6-dideoxygalactose transaminase